MKQLILASTSPRRKELMDMLDIPYTIIPSTFEEDMKNIQMKPEKLVQDFARKKAESLIKTNPNSVIIGADTVVHLNGTIFGKPLHAEEALHMLKTLSGTTHEVYTGYSIIDSESGKAVTSFEKGSITMRDVPEELLKRYIEIAKPYDKAGAYAIQGKAVAFIEKSEGDYYTVVGLPVYKIVEILPQFGIEIM